MAIPRFTYNSSAQHTVPPAAARASETAAGRRTAAAPEPEPERREVPELAAQLVLSIGILEDALVTLEGRLSPVLAYDDPQGGGEPGRTRCTDMGNCLQSAVTRIANLTDAVRRLEQRAQL